jgi:hypothetical protein
MKKNDDELFSAFFGLLILVLTLIVSIFIWLWNHFQRLFERPDAEEDPPVQRVSLFGAPTSHWWVETYERLLFSLEDLLTIPFNSSPEGLYTGGIILGSLSGAIAGRLAYWFLGWSFWQVFFLVFLFNIFSAWLLTRPVTGWWELNRSARGGANLLGPGRGFTLGRRIDE